MDWKNWYKYLVNCVYNLAYCLGRGSAKGNQSLLKQLNFENKMWIMQKTLGKMYTKNIVLRIETRLHA